MCLYDADTGPEEGVEEGASGRRIQAQVSIALPMWPWVGYCTFLSFNFLICKHSNLQQAISLAISCSLPMRPVAAKLSIQHTFIED